MAPPLDEEPRRPPRRRWLRRGLALAVAGPLLLLAALALGRSREPLTPDYEGPRPLPPEVGERFAYPEAGEPAPLLAELDEEPGRFYTTRWVQFHATTPGQAEPHKVQVIHFDPEGPGRRPAVVITPTHGGRRELARLMGATLAMRGVHGAVVLKAEEVLDADAPPARVERVLRTAVVDRRRTVDWLQGRADVAPDRIGAFGVSMGGIATALVAAVEPRIRAAVLVMAGGDLPHVVVHSSERSIGRYVDAFADRDVPPPELRRRLDRAIVSDPLALAPYVDARRVLFVQTRWDDSVPTRDQEVLHEALGRPRRTLLPTGHYGAVLYLPFVLWESIAFLEERLLGS